MPFIFNSTAGTSGVTNITVSASSRQETTDLVEYYELSNQNGFSLDMPIVQKAYEQTEKFITMSPSGLTFPSSGGSLTVQINTNDNFELDIPSWLSSPITGGTSGNTIVPFYASENTGSTNSGSVTAYCASDHTISATTNTTQNGGYVKPYIGLGYYSYSGSSESASTSVTVTSNVSWATITDSRWITINTISGSGNGSISYSIDENTSEFNREGTITVFNYDNDVFAELVIRQASGYKPFIEVYPTLFVVEASGSTGNTISVSANCDYDITTDSSWITLDAVSGSGYGSVSFSTAQNRSTTDIGNITFSNSALSRNVTVQRKEVAKYLYTDVSAITASVLTSSTVVVSVSSNVAWNVIASENERSWFTVSPLSGLNDGSITILLESGSTERDATITIYNTEYGLSCNIVLEQIIPIDGTKLYYTSTDGNIVTPKTTTGWGATIVSNTYSNGVGTIEFDGDITDIPESAFSGRTKLASVIMPETTKRIGDRAFGNCSGITAISIPKSVSGITSNSFRNCNNLETIVVDRFNEVFDSRDNCNAIIETSTNTLVIGCKTSTIPNSITKIEDYAFYEVTGFSSTNAYLDIPSGVTSVGSGAFRKCYNITGATVYGIVKSGAFLFCSGLTVLHYHTSPSLNAIYDWAFSDCTSLSEIYSYYAYPPNFVGSASRPPFENISPTGTLHYPSGSDYTAMINKLPSGWTAIADL